MENIIENNIICNELLRNNAFGLDYLFGAIDAARNDGYGSDKERDDVYNSLIKIANICGTEISRDNLGVPFVKKPIQLKK